MRFATLLILCSLALSAITLDQVIQNALVKNPSLESIKHRLKSFDASYTLSQNFSNPQVTIAIADIQLKDIDNRSLEPMQTTSITLAQKIPAFDKRDALGAQVKASEASLEADLSEFKVALVATIKQSAYSIYANEQKLHITQRYIELTRQNQALYSAYTSNDVNAHMGIMAADLQLAQLKIKKEKLQSQLLGLYKQLSYLSATDVEHLELDLLAQEPLKLEYFLAKITHNTALQNKEAKVKESDALVRVKELASIPDPTLQVGYYHRESFENYLNIGLGFSLPIYGNETAEQEKARKLLLASKSEVNDLEHSLVAQIHQVYAKMLSEYKTYTIIEKESLPQIEHMFDLASSSIKSGAELFVYFELLGKKLTLEEQKIDALGAYYKNKASLEKLTGALK